MPTVVVAAGIHFGTVTTMKRTTFTETERRALGVPADAGRYADGLARILTRFDATRGSIQCGPGWYPLLVELDERLAEICPDYVVLQVKEKFGTLRYYLDLPIRELPCCAAHADADPRPTVEHADTPANAELLTAWLERAEAHLDTAEHLACAEAAGDTPEQRDALRDRLEAVVREYEARSARTCEVTGHPGRLMRKGGSYQTLAPAYLTMGWELVARGDD